MLNSPQGDCCSGPCGWAKSFHLCRKIYQTTLTIPSKVQNPKWFPFVNWIKTHNLKNSSSARGPQHPDSPFSAFTVTPASRRWQEIWHLLSLCLDRFLFMDNLVYFCHKNHLDFFPSSKCREAAPAWSRGYVFGNLGKLQGPSPYPFMGTAGQPMQHCWESGLQL